MQRVLLVLVPEDGDARAFGMAARALRDAGHEVVHGGAIGTAGQVSAVAFQEDVDLVLLIGDEAADALADELPEGDDEPAVRVVRPTVARADVLAATSD